MSAPLPSLSGLSAGAVLAAALLLGGPARAAAPATPAPAPASGAAAPARPAAAASARAAAASKAPAAARRTPAQRVLRLDAVTVEGRVQRPQAFYILQRSGVAFDEMARPESFLPHVLRSAEGDPL